MTGPDRAVWREVGHPLVAATGSGPLDGLQIAVKDLFAVRGWPIGAGVPALLAEAAAEPDHAPAVAALLAAGARVAGIAQTDQFAYSIAGRNPHYGTPPNVASPGALPGGSSSGPASAVALGQADIGLATDTAGSIRIPASYQGLWGLRSTHGRVPAAGLLPLAPSFDTIGWLTRDADTLARVVGIGPVADGHPDRVVATPQGVEVVVAPELVQRATPAVATALTERISALEARGVVTVRTAGVGDLDALAEAFRVVQAAEAWRTHGDWITAHPGAVLGDVAQRFADATTLTDEDEQRARRFLDERRGALAEALGDRLLVLPSAASPAPPAAASAEEVQRVRSATLAMTCVAGVLGRPALSAPLLDVDGAPVGLCLVGPRDSDRDLVRMGDLFHL